MNWLSAASRLRGAWRSHDEFCPAAYAAGFSSIIVKRDSMRGAAFNIHMIAPRLFTKSEAAFYVARSPSAFERQCPVAPVQMPNGDKCWDVRDLDEWVDGLKTGRSVDDDIVSRLG